MYGTHSKLGMGPELYTPLAFSLLDKPCSTEAGFVCAWISKLFVFMDSLIASSQWNEYYFLTSVLTQAFCDYYEFLIIDIFIKGTVT